MLSIPAAVMIVTLAGGLDTTVSLTPVPTGATRKIGGYRPQRLALSDQKPATLKKAPEGISAPLYGVLTIGAADDKQHSAFHVLVDEPEGKDARLWVDANGNGDLTDDPPADWAKKAYKGQEDGKDYAQYSGGATLDLHYGDQNLPAHVAMYRFDKTDPTRAANKAVAMYYADYAYEGELQFGDKKLKTMLVDDLTTGDFRGTEGKTSGVRLLIDVNGDGKFAGRNELYDVRQPFNIGGTTYEITGMSPSGARFTLAKSSKEVAEVPPPPPPPQAPDHGVGKKVTTFAATTTDNTKISFPSSYAGKIVMVDFWATWCGPCMKEVPNLVSVYDEFHGKGFEILGISLDQENSLDKVKKVTGEKKMTWQQVYDGKFWDAEIAKLYVIRSIPSALLVDGDTGEILATTGSLRGAALKGTIEKALAKKKANVKG